LRRQFSAVQVLADLAKPIVDLVAINEHCVDIVPSKGRPPAL
jgi:hypothetical protein